MHLDNFNYLIVKSILSGKLYPVNKYMNSSEIKSVVNDCKFNKKVFPVPIMLGLKGSKKINKKYLNLYYKKKKIIKLEIESEFKLNLEKIFKKLIGKKFRFHPLYKYYKKYKYFISSKPMSQKVHKNLRVKNNLINFTTRNKPHEGHKKIINFFTKNKNKNIIISITQKNEKNNFIQIKKNYKKFLKTNKIKQKVKIYNFEFPSFKLGPREALLQSITRHNVYGGDFIIGRDHSGFKNFFKENASFRFCKKYEKYLKFKFFYSQSPFYCKKCKKINLRLECSHWKIKKFFVDISNSKLKKLKKHINAR